MQAPTTMTRNNGFNRLTAGAIGLALLAASTIGAIALNDQVDLPLIGSDSRVENVAQTDRLAEIQLIEQNSFDYASVEPIDPLFLEANSWDYQPVANYASVENIRLVEQNSFDYVTPTTAEEIRFQEANAWEYELQAQPAGEVAAESAPDVKFLEENSWDTDHLVLPEDNGFSDY